MSDTVDRLFDAKELRRAVRLLAEFVSDDRAKPTPAITDAVEIYVSASRLVNDRLGECHRLITLGQRSEALRQVQMEPDALTMYNDLQFKNVKWLTEVCEECKLPIPSRLDAAAAAKLNEAFAVEQALSGILREHRLLALSRAPLRRRLEVVRLIRKAASTELFWQDDIADYEAKRVDEIRTTMADPKLKEDWATVRDLHNEITAADGWLAPFPLDLAERVKKARNRLLGVAAESELRPLAGRLSDPARALADATETLAGPSSFGDGQDAVEAFDRTEGKVERVVTDADGVRAKYELSAGSGLMTPFVEAAEWLASGRRRRKRWREFEKAVADLDSALKNGVEWYYVQEYYRVASEYRMPLPGKVLDRFQKRAGRGIPAWLIGLIVLAVAVIAVVVVLVVKKS